MSLSSFLFGPNGPPPAATQERGLSGFIGRVTDPTNNLGRFGKALVIAGGSPLADAWRSLDDQKRQGADDLLATEYKKAQIAHLQEAPRPTGFTAELIAAGIDPNSEQGKAYLLRKVESTVDPYVTFSDANRGSYFGPRSGLPGALGMPLPNALGASEIAPEPAFATPQDVAGLFPGARMTSGYRTVAHNREVGGVANSMHTRGQGQAIDLVPGTGQTIAQLARMARSSGRFSEVVPESDHLHAGWGQKGVRHTSAPSKIIGGKAYYNVNGGWYDNPEGR